jgi:hypothetical protein
MTASVRPAAWVAPAVVRIVDLEAPLADVSITRDGLGNHYRSVMVVARLEGEPLGAAALQVAGGRVSRFQRAGALQALRVRRGSAGTFCPTVRAGRFRARCPRGPR